MRDGEYLLVECKSEVHQDRTQINKEETGQMNNACAWFAQNYPGAKAKRVMIIPTNKVANGAGFNEDVGIMRKQELTKLTKRVRAFFSEFASTDFKSLSEQKVQELIDTHGLSVDMLLTDYSKKIRA